jgi:hypothetical protein
MCCVQHKCFNKWKISKLFLPTKGKNAERQGRGVQITFNIIAQFETFNGNFIRISLPSLMGLCHKTTLFVKMQILFSW